MRIVPTDSVAFLAGFPAEIYGFGTQIFMTSIVGMLFIPPSIYFFMVVFYKLQLTSVYEVSRDWEKQT